MSFHLNEMQMYKNELEASKNCLSLQQIELNEIYT
jgi:hypothetical protein